MNERIEDTSPEIPLWLKDLNSPSGAVCSRLLCETHRFRS